MSVMMSDISCILEFCALNYLMIVKREENISASIMIMLAKEVMTLP